MLFVESETQQCKAPVFLLCPESTYSAGKKSKLHRVYLSLFENLVYACLEDFPLFLRNIPFTLHLFIDLTTDQKSI